MNMNKFFALTIFLSAGAVLADSELKHFDLYFAENKEICVNQGEEFYIQSGLTVYPWNHQKWELVDAVCMELIKEDFVRSSICMNPETGMFGGAGMQIWTFKALKHGSYTITFKRIVPTKSLDGQIEEIKTIRVCVYSNWCGTKAPKKELSSINNNYFN
jgi:predicted secreted protein